MDGTTAGAVIAAAISVGGALLTARSANRASVRSAETTSRTDIEKEAFERAQGFYTDTIDRQSGLIKAASDRADHAEARASSAESRTDDLEAALIQTYGYVRKLHTEIRRLGGHPIPPPSQLEELWSGQTLRDQG